MTEQKKTQVEKIGFGGYRTVIAQSETVPTVAPTSEPASQDAADDATAESPQ